MLLLLQFCMPTLEELLQTLSARLDESIDYANILKGHGYRSPEAIVDAGSAEDLSRECALPIGDAKRIWKAAGGATGGQHIVQGTSAHLLLLEELRVGRLTADVPLP